MVRTCFLGYMGAKQNCHYLGKKMTGHAQIATAKWTLWELIKRQCETLSVHLKKAQDFPSKNVVRFNTIMYPLWTLRQTVGTVVAATFCLWYRHWFVSKFCSSQFQIIQVQHASQNMCFIETVLMICILSQKSNPETLTILASSNSDNLRRKQQLQLFGNLSEWNVTSDVNLSLKTCLFEISELCS